MSIKKFTNFFKSYKLNQNKKLLDLKEIHIKNRGYVSDKWESYLEVYNEIFANKRNKEGVTLLEVGVQNGGSLQTWLTFFTKIKKLIGTDIDPKCSKLKYKSNKVDIVIGDINDNLTIERITNIEKKFDVIIDDGSHISSDIISTFLNLFILIKKDGLYIAEDLHCSYWKDFEGGLNKKDSANNFFKKLSDVVNMEHWINQKEDLHLHFEDFPVIKKMHIDDLLLITSLVHSIEFRNSICIIKKKKISSNLLGKRLITGKKAIVNDDVLRLKGKRASLKSYLKKNIRNIKKIPSKPFFN
tara:strand:- start:779 stop:1675 length:897 start_codon:yes stop_codon:yes gene_type:complete